MCEKPASVNTFASWMAESISRAMQGLCWSKGRDKDRETSLARKLLEDSCIVLCLRAMRGADSPEGLATVYFHAGFTNFRSWQMTVLKLYTVAEGQRQNGLLPLSITDLDAADLPDILEHQDDLDSVLESLSEHSVCTLAEALKAFVNFTHAQTLTLFKITEPSDAVARDCPPGFVYVAEMAGTDAAVEVWKGSAAEIAARSRRERKAAPEPAARRLSAKMCT